MLIVFFYRYHLGTSSGEEFQRDTSCSGKKVQNTGPFEVSLGFQYIKQVFFGKICCRPCFERVWYFKSPSLVFSCYYSHAVVICLLGQKAFSRRAIMSYGNSWANVATYLLKSFSIFKAKSCELNHLFPSVIQPCSFCI